MKIHSHYQEPSTGIEGDRGSTTGNVRVLEHDEPPPVTSAGRPRGLATAPSGAGRGGWSIVDCDDHQVGPPLASRSEALRKIGLAALRGAAMPLTVRDPDGRPTGDRLA